MSSWTVIDGQWHCSPSCQALDLSPHLQQLLYADLLYSKSLRSANARLVLAICSL
jgi:hypothetical protein